MLEAVVCMGTDRDAAIAHVISRYPVINRVLIANCRLQCDAIGKDK